MAKKRQAEQMPDFAITRIDKPCWLASDGREFDTEGAARTYSARQKLAWVFRESYYCGEGGAGPDNFADEVIEHWQEIRAIMDAS